MQRIKAAQEVATLVVPQSGESRQALTRSQKPASDYAQLVTLMAQMATHYPHQDISPAAESYLFDMKRLMERHGLTKVTTALLTLRIRPGQRFFPHPTEVAEELEAMKQAEEKSRPKYVADSNCECRKVQPGWTWVSDHDGDRVMGRCPCFLAYQGAGLSSDRKTVAGGER